MDDETKDEESIYTSMRSRQAFSESADHSDEESELLSFAEANQDPHAGHGEFVAELSKGDFFGERALITAEPRAASCIALNEVQCFVLEREGFHEVRLHR